MKIGINAVFRTKPTGVANYICNLVSHLGKVDPENEYFVYTTRQNQNYFPMNAPNVTQIHCSPKTEGPVTRRLWEQVLLPRSVKKLGIDILHCPMNVVPVMIGCPTVLTVIDTQYYQNPAQYTFLRRTYLMHMMKTSFRRADGVITISESVRNEILECFDTGGKEIRVVHFGLDPCFRKTDDQVLIDAAKKKYGIDGQFLMFPGYPHYRKNLPRLIMAFAKVRESLPEPYTLVIAGEMGREQSPIDEMNTIIKEHGIEGKVHFTGYVPGICLPEQEVPDMALLTNGAQLLVYPSMYEGFGLPVLEAMACETPVLAGDIPVSKEVGGEAVILVDPYSVDNIADGIYRGITDQALRQKLTAIGLERARMFTWDNNALETLQYYKEILGAKRGVTTA